MERIGVALLLCCILAIAGSALEIVEFCPDPYQKGDPDEYLVLEGHGPLDGFVVSDGEGGFRFPDGSRIDGRLTVARSAVAYAESHGALPDYEFFDYSPDVPEVRRSGDLRMANRADELLLYQGTTLLQQVAWPDDVASREGQIHYLEGGVWDARPLFIGQSRFRPAVFEGVRITAFVAPDCAREIFVQAVSSAESEILVNVYEFTDPGLAEELVRARQAGVNVTVLLEGGPVGGISPEGRFVAGLLARGGIPVLQMTTTERAHAAYRFDHAKYMVIDGARVLIGSENYKPSGFPAAGTRGNRGWGTYLEDPALAAYFREVFLHDSSGGDIAPLAGTAAEVGDPRQVPYTVEFEPVHRGGVRVTPVLSPDTSFLITDLLEGATRNIAIEQAYITNETAYELNPYLAAAINASRRGVEVRVILDSAWFNTEGDADNDEMVGVINRIAAAEGLPLEARLADCDGNNLEKIHTKGVVVDERAVLISSINWNANSPGFNREAGVIIEDAAVAAYFTSIFRDDWEAATTRGRTENGIGSDPAKAAAAFCIIIGLAALYWYRHRR
ncbi:phospholipase [Methanoculleus sp. FWC-SCC1]|uniref:Phospholipase n=1 Tax=Methanoculleus frigidifontis TaxID=2584085 RepID=A0ABT8MAF2_9EURY|nr:phospholipase D-like domain-containing protein [Methanoculleus sp. FWC-SCC1]MDN7024924.1 phospholipase [Methanoculleus sp. FWC-SCC1]